MLSIQNRPLKAIVIFVITFLVCSPSSLGLSNHELSDLNFNASSSFSPFAPRDARLYANTSWANEGYSSEEFLQISFHPYSKLITGVATQGNPHHDWWIYRYYLQYSLDGFTWSFYEVASYPGSRKVRSVYKLDTRQHYLCILVSRVLSYSSQVVKERTLETSCDESRGLNTLGTRGFSRVRREFSVLAEGRSHERRTGARVTIKTWQKPETALEKFLWAKQKFCTCIRILVHFFDVHCTTTTWNLPMRRFMEDVDKRRQISLSLFEHGWSP